MIKKIKEKGKGFPSLQEYAIHLIKTLDTNNNGVVDIKEFSEGLAKMGIFASKHEEHTLMRKFDETGNG